jgi:hypothetical protein
MNHPPHSKPSVGPPGFWIRSGGPDRAIEIVMVMRTTINSARHGDNGWEAGLDPRSWAKKPSRDGNKFERETKRPPEGGLSVALKGAVVQATRSALFSGDRSSHQYQRSRSAAFPRNQGSGMGRLTRWVAKFRHRSGNSFRKEICPWVCRCAD